MFMGAWKECVFCCWMKKSIDVNYIQLINGGVEFTFVLTDFPPAGTVLFRQRGAKVPTYHSGFIYSSFSSIRFCLMHFDVLLSAQILRTYVFLGNWPLHHYAISISLFSLPMFLTLNSSFSEFNIATPASFWLVL